MTSEPLLIYDHLQMIMRKHFLSDLKRQHSLPTDELNLFDWFRAETEETWTRMRAEEQRRIQEQIDAGVEEVDDSGVIAVDYYCKRMRYSHVIFLASLLEGAMKFECDRLDIALGDIVLFKPSDLKGDPWSARKVFLEGHGSFRIPDDLWGSIKDLLAVRNALVHHNGEISLLTQEQVAVLGKIAGVDSKQTEVGLTVSYLNHASQSVRDLMKFVHEKTNSVIDRALRPQAIT